MIFNCLHLCTSVTDTGSHVTLFLFSRLDIVKFKATVSQVKRAQDGHGGWNDKMANVGKLCYRHR